MSAWTSKPRVTPMAGHRKATHRWCAVCDVLHRTHRAVGGEEVCPEMAATRQERRKRLFSGPHVRAPRVERAKVTMGFGRPA